MDTQLLANPDLCTGCNRCTYACSAARKGVFRPSAARVQVSNFPLRGYAVPSICFQCPKAACQESCAAGAMSRSEAGAVVVDPAKCTGCGLCVKACPYGMIELDEAEKAGKCDYCGGDPACVKECHAAALQFAAPDYELLRHKAAQMKNRSSQGSPREKRHHLAEKLMKQARS